MEKSIMPMGVRVLLDKPKVYCYQISKTIRQKRGYTHRSSDWDTKNPVGRYRIVIIAAKEYCCVELINPNKVGPLQIAGQSFKVLTFPGPVVQPVSDSSRFFAIRVKTFSSKYVNDDNDPQLIGIGFSNRQDSLDFTQVLQNFFVHQPRFQKQQKFLIPLSHIPTQASNSMECKTSENVTSNDHGATIKEK